MGINRQELDLFPNLSAGEDTSRGTFVQAALQPERLCDYERKPAWMRSNALTSASISSQVL
jgi:hypothetical protein